MQCEGVAYDVWYDGFQMKLGKPGFTLWTIPDSQPHLYRRFDSTASTLLEAKSAETPEVLIEEPWRGEEDRSDWGMGEIPDIPEFLIERTVEEVIARDLERGDEPPLSPEVLFGEKPLWKDENMDENGNGPT